MPDAFPGILEALVHEWEMAASTLNTVHNLHFYLDTMRRIRKAIEFGILADFARAFLDRYTRRARH
jgi:tRNA-guanine family transglycosylase